MFAVKFISWILTAAVFVMAMAQPALAQPTKISVGYSAISGDALPA